MKYLLILLLSLSLNAAGFWTLTGLTKSNVYVKNELSMVKPETIVKIKEKMAESLKKNGILTGQQDSSTLMVSLEELTNDETYYVYIKLSLGEEVQTFRADKSATFALTYDSSDFVELEVEDLDSGVLESIEYLLLQFSEHYEEDNE
jgi:hypothetical protein